MTFSVSGVETAIWIPPLVGMVISFFTSMGGVSGAFLILPFQGERVGLHRSAVTPTNLIFNIVGIPVVCTAISGKAEWLGLWPGISFWGPFAAYSRRHHQNCISAGPTFIQGFCRKCPRVHRWRMLYQIVTARGKGLSAVGAAEARMRQETSRSNADQENKRSDYPAFEP